MFGHFCLKCEFEYPSVILVELKSKKFSLFILSNLRIKTQLLTLKFYNNKIFLFKNVILITIHVFSLKCYLNTFKKLSHIVIKNSCFS